MWLTTTTVGIKASHAAGAPQRGTAKYRWKTQLLTAILVAISVLAATVIVILGSLVLGEDKPATPLDDASGSRTLTFDEASREEDEESLPYWRRQHVVIPPLEREQGKLEAAVAAKIWPAVDWDFRAESGDIVPLEQAATRSFDRFDFITGRRPSDDDNDDEKEKKTRLTLSECAATAEHCGRAGGRLREFYRNACWCLRLWKRSVAYLPQTGLDNEGHDPNRWRSEVFQSLHMAVNLLSATLHTYNPLDENDRPIYLVVNVYDYPRLFTPVLHSDAPKVTSGHPAEENAVEFDFYAQISFKGGFPERLDACEPHQDPSNDDCCDTPLHFPVFSWSINPVFNFDIVAPNRHSGSCLEKFFEQEIATVPWEEKSRTVMSRGSSRCYALQSGDHRSRFCAMVQRQRRFLERALDLKLDIFGGEVSPAQQAKTKFLILLDGAVAAFRSTWYLSAGSVILAAGTHVDMRTSLLRPYVHFIPFKADYSDFAEALSLVALNDEYAQWVGENARRVGRMLSQKGEDVDGGHEGDKKYWAALLKEYRTRYDFVMDNGEVEETFTMETSCDDYAQEIENRAKNNKCLGSEYACDGKIQDGYMNYKGVEFHDRESEVPPMNSEEEKDHQEESDNDDEEAQSEASGDDDEQQDEEGRGESTEDEGNKGEEGDEDRRK